MTRCLSCRANAINLSLIHVIKEYVSKYQIKTLSEILIYRAILNYLKLYFKDVCESEYLPKKKPGENLDCVLNDDLQDLTFATNSLDLIRNKQVFDYSSDGIKVYRECSYMLNKIINYKESDYQDRDKAGPRLILTFWRDSMHKIVSQGLIRC